MSTEQERAELLAALHASGAASLEDERELEKLLIERPELEQIVQDFSDSIAALATSFDPLETSPKTLRKIQKKIRQEQHPSLWQRWLGVFTK